jgi:multiple sugar transport system ATP-binding protein
MAKIELKNISKAFGPMSIIDNLNLEITDGEFVVLVGASGCGKSTTLRMIAGLESVTDGQIMIGDKDVTDLGPGKRNCAMVFQNYALYPHMTVAENIGFGLRLRGMSKAKCDSAVRSAADTLGLSPLLDRLPKALSGGQRQRVAIGRAIVRKPDVFLFDEPLSNLDAKLRIEMRTEIKELHHRLGTTIVYVTHDQVEAMTMADRVVVMDKGKIAQAASPLILYEKPVNIFVAGFIGAPSMNFIPCIFENSREKSSLLLSDGTRLQLAQNVALDSSLQSGKQFTLGLRPEDICRGTGETLMNVRSVETLGSHTLAIGQIAGAQATIELAAHDSVKPGDQLPVEMNSFKVHLFEQKTGVRVGLN